MAKVYTQVYDISQPTEQRFWTPPFSNFKIGLKVTNKGEEVQGALSLKAGDTALSAEETEIDGFTIFPVSSTSAGSTVYTLSAEGVPETMKLVQVTTGSTVFEIDEKGSGGGTVDAYTKAETDALLSTKADETELTGYATKDELTGYVENGDLTAYYTKSDTSSATEIGTALEGKQPAGNYLTAETEPAFAAMSADIVVDGDLTAYYTKSETSSAAELADAFAGAGGGGAISAFDLSESPVWSKTMVENAVKTNTCLPQTIFLLEDNTLSVADIVGVFNVNSVAGATSGNRVKKLIVGTNVSAVDSTINDYNRLQEIVLPDSLVLIKSNAFVNGGDKYCIISIPNSVSAIANPRYKEAGETNGYRYMDFGNTRTSVPTVGTTTAVSISCKYYVPDALYDTWIAANKWSSISAQIHRHSELEAPYATSTAVSALTAANSKVTGGAETGTTGTPAAVNAVKSVYETDWAALSATADANTFYVVLPDPA